MANQSALSLPIVQFCHLLLIVCNTSIVILQGLCRNNYIEYVGREKQKQMSYRWETFIRIESCDFRGKFNTKLKV